MRSGSGLQSTSAKPASRSSAGCGTRCVTSTCGRRVESLMGYTPRIAYCVNCSPAQQGTQPALELVDRLALQAGVQGLDLPVALAHQRLQALDIGHLFVAERGQ